MAACVSIRATPRPDAELPPPRRRHESGEQLALQQAPAADLAPLLAHDVRSPLATIAMNLEFVLAELGPSAPAEVRAALEDSIAAGVLAVRIVAEMAEAARFSAGERRVSDTEVDVVALASGIMGRLASFAASRQVVLAGRARPSVARADADLLGRAIERLVEWCIKHTCKAGRVELDVDGPVVQVRLRPPSPEQAVPVAAAHAGLATHFAGVALRAQGGGLWTEAQPDGSLLFSIALPR